jgi:hypothetical protein
MAEQSPTTVTFDILLKQIDQLNSSIDRLAGQRSPTHALLNESDHAEVKQHITQLREKIATLAKHGQRSTT